MALAEAIAETIERKQGQRTDLVTSAQNCAEVATERADEIAAKKAGLGSAGTLRAAQKVVERGIPELVEAIAERLQGRVGNPELHANSGNISGIERGDTRDIAAAKAGLGSGATCNHPRAARSSNHPLTPPAERAYRLAVGANNAGRV